MAALGEYLDRHPQWETPEVRIKIEQQSTLSRDKLAEIVRQMVEEENGYSTCFIERARSHPGRGGPGTL